MDPSTCRALFPALGQGTFLNHAGIAPCSTRVAAAMQGVIAEQAQHGSGGYRRWTQLVAGVRRQAAALLGAGADEIAFVPNTSTGLSLVAEALPWQAGDAVLVPVPDFPANVYPWQHLARHGVELVSVPRRNGRLEPADVERALVPGARLLALSSVDYATGFSADLAAFGAFCRERGLLLVVDAIQSLGVRPLDVKRCGIHALAAGAHKWLCGPQGIGLLYVDRTLLPRLAAPLAGWKSVVDEEDFSLHFTLRGDAAVFEPGTLNLAGIAGLGAALDLLEEIGGEAVAARIQALTGELSDGLQARGWRVAGPWPAAERAGIVAFAGPAGSQVLFRHLTAGGVTVARRDDRIRLSPHFANDAADLARFFTLLERCPRP